MAEAVKVRVNGTDRDVNCGPTTPLLYYLRNDLGLRATRHGCGEGNCGACTVLLDGRPVTSCNTSVEAAVGHDVETIEALADRSPTHPLVAALLQEQAGQCGYCLSGILMRAKALLAENPEPTRADVVAGLDAHLCRCGAHNRIVRAILEAGRRIKAEALT